MVTAAITKPTDWLYESPSIFRAPHMRAESPYLLHPSCDFRIFFFRFFGFFFIVITNFRLAFDILLCMSMIAIHLRAKANAYISHSIIIIIIFAYWIYIYIECSSLFWHARVAPTETQFENVVVGCLLTLLSSLPPLPTIW